MFKRVEAALSRAVGGEVPRAQADVLVGMDTNRTKALLAHSGVVVLTATRVVIVTARSKLSEPTVLTLALRDITGVKWVKGSLLVDQHLRNLLVISSPDGHITLRFTGGAQREGPGWPAMIVNGRDALRH